MGRHHSPIKSGLIIIILLATCFVIIRNSQTALAINKQSVPSGNAITSKDQFDTEIFEAVVETGYKQIAAGLEHTCAITSSGGVKCWGLNAYGALGNGTTIDSYTPVDVSGLSSGVIAIAAGGIHTCALTDTGGVKCWGSNYVGQLGDNTTTDSSIPVDVFGLTGGVIAITTGYQHTCAITNTGGAKCWGDNEYGRLGDGTTDDSSVPVDVVGMASGVSNITAGDYHTCAIQNGSAKCWGENSDGQLGDGTTNDREVPVNVLGLSSGMKQINAGEYHTCAVTSAGGIKCWGNNLHGQLGDNTTTESHIPVHVIGLSTGTNYVSAENQFNCALTSSSGVKCWGRNIYGQLGDGTTTERHIPVDVSGLSGGVIALATGSKHGCAILSSGAAVCWGSNSSGQLSDGNATRHTIPAEIFDTDTLYSMISTGEHHACGVTSTGGAKCWGDNYSGRLGDGTTRAHWQPKDVQGLTSNVDSVATGLSHSCALTTSGGVKCWGSNNSGQLGDGTKTDSLTAVDVFNLNSGVQSISASAFDTCALTGTGAVKCWGGGETEPYNVEGLNSGVQAITAGSNHFCVLTATDGVKCWGHNWDGQLGDGSNSTQDLPVDVIGLASGVSYINAGASHTCALLEGGGAKCWGRNSSGQLGDGTLNDSNVPVTVNAFTGDAEEINGGSSHTCILDSSGGVQCWGNNAYGQLGNGTLNNSLQAVEADGLLANVSSIIPGQLYTCAIASGRGKCWGSDFDGQLGVGRPVYQLTPTPVIEDIPAQIILSQSSGTTGSYFTITGNYFPPNGTLSIEINGQVLTTSNSVNETGSFVLFLSTDSADSGMYTVTASVNPSAQAGFILGAGAPERLKEGGGTTLDVPAGISVNETNFLPLIGRK